MAKEVVENQVAEVEEFDPTVVYAQLVKQDDGYHVIDFDGTVGPVCKITKDGLSIALTPNRANRQWMLVSVAEKSFETSDHIDLYYKPTKHIGSGGGGSILNKNLIKYLSEDEQAELIAIVERAKAAKAADRPAPKTEADRLRDKIAKLQAQLDSMPIEG